MLASSSTTSTAGWSGAACSMSSLSAFGRPGGSSARAGTRAPPPADSLSPACAVHMPQFHTADVAVPWLRCEESVAAVATNLSWTRHDVATNPASTEHMKKRLVLVLVAVTAVTASVAAYY